MGISNFVKICIVLCYVIMLKIFLFLCIDHQIGTVEQLWLEELQYVKCEELDVTIAKESTPVWHLEIERFYSSC